MQAGIGMRVFLYSYTKPCIFASLFCHVISHCFNFFFFIKDDQQGWERERHSMSLISLITLVRNFTFTSMDHTVSHFISLFFFFNFLSIDTTGFKNKKPSTRERLLLFAFLWLNFHGAFGVCLTPPKWKQLIPQFSNLKFAFKMTINSRGWRLVDIALDIKFQQKEILNGDRLWIVLNKKTQVKVFCKHCMIRKKNAQI